MRVSGCNSVLANRAREISLPRGRGSGSGFLDRLKSASDTAASEKAADTLDLTKTDDELRTLLHKLTPGSRDVLDRMESGKADVSKDEWTGLCKELESLGAISEYDFMHTRSDLCLIPIGYMDENGEPVLYEDCPIMRDRLQSMGKSVSHYGMNGLWACISEDSWKGDPLEYLDSWIDSLYSWRSDLARIRKEDGTPKYDHFDPLTNKINSCQKVTDLVRALWKCEEGAGL